MTLLYDIDDEVPDKKGRQTRDTLISVGTGRPRTINLEDSTTRPPTVEDFAAPDFHAHLFIAYVSISRHMGDITEAHRRKALSDSSRKQRLEDALFRWLKELPSFLQIVHKQRVDSGNARTNWTVASYSFEARQLAIHYFVSLILLHRTSSPQTSVPTVCLMASSYVANILEEFVSRDQLRYLGPVFAFYALAAGLVQLTVFRHEHLQSMAEHELNVIQVALQELGKRWGSAHGALRALVRAKDAVRQQERISRPPALLSPSESILFTDFGPELCRLWYVGFLSSQNATISPVHVGEFRSQAEASWGPTAMSAHALVSLAQDSRTTTTVPPVAQAEDPENGQGLGIDDLGPYEDPLTLAEGSWLFEDFDLQSYLAP